MKEGEGRGRKERLKYSALQFCTVQWSGRKGEMKGIKGGRRSFGKASGVQGNSSSSSNAGSGVSSPASVTGSAPASATKASRTSAKHAPPKYASKTLQPVIDELIEAAAKKSNHPAQVSLVHPQ